MTGTSNSHVGWTLGSQGYSRIEVDFIGTAVNLQELSWVLFLQCGKDTECNMSINSNKPPLHFFYRSRPGHKDA